MISIFFQSIRIFLVMTLITGLVYPLTVTGLGQLLFPEQANGSLVYKNEKVIGSILISQKTESARLFWPRPSASDYGALPSGASNQGPTSRTLKSAIIDRKSRGLTHEMIFVSASGLDPHVSIDAAIGQLPRIVESRKLSNTEIQKLQDMIQSLIEPRDFGFLGEPRINVLKLNLKVINEFGE